MQGSGGGGVGCWHTGNPLLSRNLHEDFSRINNQRDPLSAVVLEIGLGVKTDFETSIEGSAKCERKL